jgi:hypothetical protein
MTYVETVTATGSLNGVAYTNSLITLTATGDTTGIVSISPIAIANPVSVTLTVESLGQAATFTGDYIVFRSGSLAGIIRGTPSALGSDLLDVNNSTFNTYDLATAIGPIAGVASYNATTGFATNVGTFFINSVSGNATFQATATAVPEPSSLALCGIGIALAGALAHRRNRRESLPTGLHRS